MPKPIRPVLALLLALLLASAARAEDAYFEVPLKQLKITHGELPAPRAAKPATNDDEEEGPSSARSEPRVVIEPGAEAYVNSGSARPDVTFERDQDASNPVSVVI